ncbi:MAG: hypothetical protein LBB56_06695 [Chitinispirillales bacterium]|jgi:hypothetical protein|nr:hypothetical protein [Chitinispirillales bacterium]
MIIANPIYDVTFKHLLLNDRAAKFFIGTILNCKVLSLEPVSTEYTEPKDETPTVSLFRMDFAATIVTKEEGEKRVIIEMQKAKILDDVFRFRRYLGKEYRKSELPIIAIYILGFNLSVDSPAFGNFPIYRDLRTNEKLDAYDLFVEQLTHKAYFVQTKRIKPSLNTKLDKLLSVFEQKNFIGDDETTKDYKFEVDDPDLKVVVDVLKYVASDAKAREELEREQYYQDAMEGAFGKQNRELAETKEKLEYADKKLEEKDKELEKKDKEFVKLQQKMRNIAKKLKLSGESAEEISESTGMPPEEIDKI